MYLLCGRVFRNVRISFYGWFFDNDNFWVVKYML